MRGGYPMSSFGFAARRSFWAAAFICVLAIGLSGCPKPRDPHIVENPGDLPENRGALSPPTLGYPIYACGSSITVANFLQGATIEVFIDSAPAPKPSFIGQIPNPGQAHETGMKFTEGMVIHVRQVYKGVPSKPSNSVTVTSHTVDFPNGLPQPRLFAHPLYQCGHAVLVEDVVPNSTVTIETEDSDGAGGFKPIQQVGGFQASTQWGLNWSGVSPQFELAARVSATAQICTDTSPRSPYEITVAGPSPVPGGSVEKPVVDGQSLVTLWGAAGPTNDPLQHGVIATVYDGASKVRGQSSTPGGVPHILGISPSAKDKEALSVTQTLCTEGPPGPPTTVGDCSALPAPTIQAPMPGDTKVIVTSQIPGAEIFVYADNQNVGHSSGSVINLSRALKDDETVIVEQRLGNCKSKFVYRIKVECTLGASPGVCSGEWPTFRQNPQRTARQPQASPLSDPYQVRTLAVKATTRAPDGGVFTASPVVFGGRVYIGSSGGHLYAFDAKFGQDAAPLWQYPPAKEQPLANGYVGHACTNPSSGGVAASVSIAQSKERGTLIILGGPDPGRPDDPGGKFGSGLGSGRLFALTTAGALVWKTRDEIARMTGVNSGSTSELHEQIGYSAPLVLGSRIYVGIADHCDNPIQNGKVKAVDLDTGAVDAGFKFESTNTRGGGVWTFVSGGLGNALVTTTGNVANGNASEPSINHGLSMVRLDPATGALNGKIQPVPFALDSDPDWSAGAALIAASCGNIAASTMKDGFSYGANLGPPLSFRWQYPNVAYPFPSSDPNDHGDIRYHRAGAAWNDTYATSAGGQQLLDKGGAFHTFQGYRHLHAFDVCTGRPRWVALLESFTTAVMSTHDWGLSPPSVTDGIVYVGTNRGFVLAIADPAVWPSQGARCTMPTFTNPTDCIAAGYALVPNPTVLKSLKVSDVGLVRGEPALANGMIYIGEPQGARRLIRIGTGNTP